MTLPLLQFTTHHQFISDHCDPPLPPSLHDNIEKNVAIIVDIPNYQIKILYMQ